MTEPSKGAVAIIGCGEIGRSWAELFAVHGYIVNLYDNDPEASKFTRDETCKGIVRARRAFDRPLNNSSVRVFDEIRPALDGVFYIQESVPEDLPIKREVFDLIDAAAPQNSIIGSSTSQFAGSLFMSSRRLDARCLVVHPMNPASHLPIVELVPTPLTQPDAVDKTGELMRSMGRVPIVVNKEVQGFVLNRLQMSLLREALWLIQEEICAPDDVDKVLQYGLGRRWAALGIFQAMHLNAPGGSGDYLRKFKTSMNALMADLCCQTELEEDVIAQIENSVSKSMPINQIRELQLLRNDLFDKLAQCLSRDGVQALEEINYQN